VSRRALYVNVILVTAAMSAVAGYLLGTADAPTPAHVAASAPAASSYETCVRAANTPGPSGYAVETCESLLPGFVHGARVNLGSVRTEYPDGTVTETPPLALDIVDSCADVGYSVACVESVIANHRITGSKS
jgi:hypothetical protein